MEYKTRRFRFAIPSFPFAVLGTAGLYQLSSDIPNGLSLPLGVAITICLGLIGLWLTQCTSYRSIPSLRIDQHSLRFGEQSIPWQQIKWAKLVFFTMNPHILFCLDSTQLHNPQHEEDVFLGIPLSPFQRKFELLETFQKNYLLNHPQSSFGIPSRLRYYGHMSLAIAGATLLIIVLFIVIFGLGAWIYSRA
jgi:hypothetical protein